MQQDRTLRRNFIIVIVVLIATFAWPFVHERKKQRTEEIDQTKIISERTIGKWEAGSGKTLTITKDGTCIWNETPAELCGYFPATDVPRSLVSSPTEKTVYLVSGMNGENRAYRVVKSEEKNFVLHRVDTDEMLLFVR